MNPKAREKEGRLNIYGFNDWEFPKINDRQVTDSSNTKQDKQQEKQSPSKPTFKLLETLKGRKEKETHAHTCSFKVFVTNEMWYESICDYNLCQSREYHYATVVCCLHS